MDWTQCSATCGVGKLEGEGRGRRVRESGSNVRGGGGRKKDEGEQDQFPRWRKNKPSISPRSSNTNDLRIVYIYVSRVSPGLEFPSGGGGRG